MEELKNSGTVFEDLLEGKEENECERAGHGEDMGICTTPSRSVKHWLQ